MATPPLRCSIYIRPWVDVYKVDLKGFDDRRYRGLGGVLQVVLAGWARRAGIAEREFDGGYVVNGWLQYAHPEHAARAPDGNVLVPWVTGGEALHYGIVNRAPAGARVLHEVAHRRILAPSGRIHVIDRMPGASGAR